MASLLLLSSSKHEIVCSDIQTLEPFELEKTNQTMNFSSFSYAFCHLELFSEEYQSFFWQINIFSFSTPYSVSSLRQPHLIPLAIVATASTK